MKKILIFVILVTQTWGLIGQSTKTPLDEKAITYIQHTFDQIMISDQKYRGQLQYQTTVQKILTKIDSLLNNVGIEEGIAYVESLNLKLNPEVKDSLTKAQLAIDFTNHMTMRGIWEKYGWINKDIVEENNSVQILLLMHPPFIKEQVPSYLNEYTALLKAEVKSSRMPPKTFAMFYDNIKAKILGKPQLYGTNQVFDSKTMTVLPPGILDLEKTNNARKAIGLPQLNEGEYRILSSEI